MKNRDTLDHTNSQLSPTNSALHSYAYTISSPPDTLSPSTSTTPYHLRQRRCLYAPHTPGPHLQRMACATHCARTTNATTLHAPNPPTAAHPHRDAPQLTTGKHIQERTTTRTRTKHRYPRRSPPRPHRARTRRSTLPCREHHLAQHGSDTIRHTPRILSPTMPRLRPCQTQQGQQTNLVKTTTGPTTSIPSRHTLTHTDHHQKRSFTGRHPKGTRGGHTLGDRRMHQLRQRWTH